MIELTIAKSLNKAYRQIPVDRTAFDSFKKQLHILYEQISSINTEEKLKGDLMDFLKLTFYGQNYKVSPNGDIDCAIHLGNSIDDPVGVIFEVKKPTNVSEMITREDLNRKALQELLLYYLRERHTKKNFQLKQLVVTNINEFFVFDAQEFERLFYSNKKLIKRFEEFSAGELTSEKTNFFYKEIAADFIAKVVDQLTFTWFDIRKYKIYLDTDNDKRLIELFKFFSPENLLKKRFQNDSNLLNTKFYSELLYIIGLEEVEEKDSHKRIITRSNKNERHQASILENAINILDAEDCLDNVEGCHSYGKTREEQLFGVALALTINWVNRVLFLKLLEAQLVKYHKGNQGFAFLSPSVISDYDELNKLFFQVLAKRVAERPESINTKYGKVPYLNSSLFEISSLERQTIRISNLENNELPLFAGTVLKDGSKPRYKQLPTLRYLLEFLDAYDFASEGSEEVQEQSKTLINASVLGLIFEKINGHKDGSVFTPGAVTMYMSREAIQQTVVRRFNEEMNWSCNDYDALKNMDIEDIAQANAIIDSLRICDPAVGSGHFLVSVLNEIIRTKYDLGILVDSYGKRIKKQDYSIDIENDELLVSDEDGNPFSYVPSNAESQRIQETLFNEKRKIIENCLFGVDLNPNAVNICRLRLWIELLKNAYYTKESGFTELETLPNIDINIKVGNSLLHRFDLSQDISGILRKNGISIGDYCKAVNDYKNAHSKEEKKTLVDYLKQIKGNLRTQIGQNDLKLKEKQKLESELNDLLAPQLFEISKKEQAARDKKAKDLQSKIAKLQKEIDEIHDNKVFVDAFEWRIEFPEVLDENGKFIGFDCVIGNPPYIQLQKMGTDADALQKMNYQTYERTGDIYCLFYEMGMALLKPNALLSFITSNKWMRAGYGESLRKYFSEQQDVIQLVDFAGYKIFSSATVDVNILFAKNRPPKNMTLACSISKEGFDLTKLSDFVKSSNTMCVFKSSESWVILSPIEQSIKRKIETAGVPLKDWNISIYRGVLTGYNEAFIITSEKRDEILNNCLTEEEKTRTAALIRPILRGRDIKRYGYNWADIWLIYIPWHFPLQFDDSIQGASEIAEQAFKELYPTVYQHMLKYKAPLSERNKAETGVRYEWYAMQRWGANYWDDFYRPKIVWAELARTGNAFSVDFSQHLVSNTGYILTVTGDDENLLYYLLGILNSRIMLYCLNQITSRFDENGWRWLRQFVEQLRVPNDTNIMEISELARATNRCNQMVNSELINKLVAGIYGIDDEEQKYINDKLLGY